MDRAGLLKQTKLSSSLSLSRQGKVKEPGLWLTKRVEGGEGAAKDDEIMELARQVQIVSTFLSLGRCLLDFGLQD